MIDSIDNSTHSNDNKQHHFVGQILRLSGTYWNAPHKWKVRGFTALLIALTVAQVGMAIWLNYWNRELFDALEQRSTTEFLKQIGIFLLIFVMTMLITSAHLHVKRWIQIDWRQWLTEQVMNYWLARGNHYHLAYTPGEHDNPDGRIAEDIRIVTESVIAMAHTLLYSLLILASFIDILYTLSGSITIPGTSLVIPAYMVILAFAYAAIGTIVGWSLGKPLTQATNALQSAEANFRFGLTRIRENSEAIALMRGEKLERRNTFRLLTDITLNWTRQTFAYTWIVSYSAGYGALLPVFPILIAAPQYIAGTMTLGVLMQAAMAFQKLTGALSWPIDNLGELARCRASADRILTLYEDLLKLETAAGLPNANRITLGHAKSRELIINNLCLADRDGLILLENFNEKIHHGDHVLISGDTQIATSLFNAMAGLWPWGSGDILLPIDQPVVFMSQQPFLPEGTLRSALCYPRASEEFTESDIEHALECAGLLWLSERLNEHADWGHILPLRTQQRLGFARLQLHKPCWIVIDEATNAFDPHGEYCIIDMLKHELPNATLITIGFSKGLEQQHERKLVMQRMDEKKYLFNGKKLVTG